MLTLSKFSSSCIINKHIKYLLFVFIGTVCMSSSCFGNPDFEHVKFYNNSDRDIFFDMLPMNTDYTETGIPYSGKIGPMRYIPSGKEILNAVASFYGDYYGKTDWCLLITYPETVEKYTMKTVESEGIYDDYILVSYQERVIDKKVIYNGKDNN